MLREAKADGTQIPENAAQHLHKPVAASFANLYAQNAFPLFVAVPCPRLYMCALLTPARVCMLTFCSIIDPDIEVAKVATTLEWVIPTPPPLHGFAEPPILVLAPDQTAREQRGH